jgi:hypothetical protein
MTMATDPAREAVICQAAFDHIRALQARDLVLDHETIKQGFVFDGERWPLWNPQRGIFKPRGLPFLLSIRTVYPRKGARMVRRPAASPRPDLRRRGGARLRLHGHRPNRAGQRLAA